MHVGYTLPVFACASAIAALRHLHQEASINTVKVNLIKPSTVVDVPVEQVARIDSCSAIAITRSDPGNHLDLTSNTPIWAKVSLSNDRTEKITIEGGEGIGRQGADKAAIYSYARELFQVNLKPLLQSDETIVVTIILPEGKRLAQRTSNEAFGVVEGLSLLGTTGIVQPLTAPGQLEAYQAQIRAKAALYESLVFCIGENGIELAQRSGIGSHRIIKTANWLGSMLVTAGAAGVKSVLLFGYHGKLIKLAGGIFHTHNHLADGRLEILTAYCAKLGLSQSDIVQVFNSSTTEAAFTLLRAINHNIAELVYAEIAQAIDQKSEAYICKYTEKQTSVGSILFDRQRKIIVKSENARLLLADLC